MVKSFRRALAALALSGLSGLAFAQSSCESILSVYASDPVLYSSYPSEHPECFAGSATVSNTQITATAFTQANAVSRLIAARMTGAAGGPPVASLGQPHKGLAAGSAPQAWNIWGSIDQNDTRFSYRSGAATESGANDIQTTVVGADYAWAPNMILGLSVALDRGDGWGFNTANGLRNNTNTDGYIIAPYLGYQLSKEFALDVSAGMGEGDFSAVGGLAAEADRWFAAANLSYARWAGNWQYTGKASYMHGEEDYSNSKINGVTQANTASKNKLDQVRLGVQAGYWMNGVMPFAGLSYTSNIRTSSTLPGGSRLGRDSFVATLGANFFSLTSKVTGGIFYEEELNRSNSDSRVISANINFRF